MNELNEAHPQSLLLAVGKTLNRIDLDMNSIQRIKAELREIKNNCGLVLKQLKEVD